MGIFEIMAFDDEIRDLIMKHASTNVLRVAARKGRNATICARTAWPRSTTG